jgi:hypothetical protein
VCALVAAARRAEAPPPAAPDDLADDAGAEAGADLAVEAAPEDGAGFDPGRKLCPEGACLGVLGSDGRCSVCGRTAEG